MSFSSTLTSLLDANSGYWRLDETSGTTIADSSGNSHGGSITGSPTMGATGLLAGDSDTAFSFAGSGTGVISFASWMNRTTSFATGALFQCPTSGSARYLTSRGTSGSSFVYSLGVDSSGRLFANINISGTQHALGPTLPAGGSLRDSATHMAVLTYDGTTASLYVDGTLLTSGSWSGSLQTPASGSIVIAAGPSGAGGWLGTIDEPFFGPTLTSTQVANLWSLATGSASTITGAASLTESTSVTVSGRKTAIAAAAPTEATSATIGGRVTARAAVTATESTEVDVTAGATLEAAASPTEASSVTVGAVPSRVAAVSIAELTSLAVAAALDQMAAVAIVEDTSVAVSTASGLAVTITEATSLVVAGVVLSIGPVDDNLANAGALTMTGWSTSGYVVDPPSGGVRADIPAVHVEPA